MKRRDFLRMVGGVTAAGGLGLERLLADFKADDDIVGRVAGLPRRVLGRTQQQISIVGFPGLGLIRVDQEGANKAVREAFDRGVNYYDVAPAYGNDGECEIKLGPALRQLDRSKVFLGCKTKARDKEGARTELERSLKRLQTDHFDLYQLHHLVTVDEVKRAFGPGGAFETFLAARDEGKVKWFGFSAHSTKAALAALEAYAFDTVMFPISFADYYLRDFGRAVIDAAAKRGSAVIAIKPLSMGAWPKDVPRTRSWWYRTTETPEEVSLALRFSLSLRGVITGIPPSYLDLLDMSIAAAKSYKPATVAEKDELRVLAEKCEALFLREDQRGDTAGVPSACPYPDHLV
ncbi:MAG: aldo/keto reductase [Verrucomicrobia bacterium]|jgi:predicted aldo/keto reductase-like oxidoreductase|nr:aldo/keto reductase [Verrucomicrobiota bacterium]OQC63099.1 MAG: General stress protein 69 [Verrucomicrobia bacterium ADurb.Bin006]MDI9381756.1 aldo/keto reductase [Verrucomicrobiota bacterium]NMD21945.1 aldo/keto reductase [Verrucomicrobiota bacterium]HNU99728.1 aldo/keto reductase [Verrucomicrobiota bacterium]